MADHMADLMAGHAARVGTFAAGGALWAYLMTDDDRWLAVAVAMVFAIVASQVVKRVAAARRVVDADVDATLADIFAADEEALRDLPDPLDRDDLDLAEAVDALAPLFEELDGNPMAQAVAARARRRERVCLSIRQRRAWVAITASLGGPDPTHAPRCVCDADGGVLTPSRSCPFHGRHAW